MSAAFGKTFEDIAFAYKNNSLYLVFEILLKLRIGQIKTVNTNIRAIVDALKYCLKEDTNTDSVFNQIRSQGYESEEIIKDLYFF